MIDIIKEVLEYAFKANQSLLSFKLKLKKQIKAKWKLMIIAKSKQNNIKSKQRY